MARNLSKQMNIVRILALRPYEVPSWHSDVKSNNLSGIRMHRVLKENELYKLFSGFEIIDDSIITLSINKPQELYDVNQRERKTPLKVSFSAIVGENGSGKSTIIDYIIRIVNNLSAVLFGEFYYSASSEHLHYINNVNAEMYVVIDETIYRISCEDKTTKINLYELTNIEKGSAVFKKSIDKEKTFLIDPNEPYSGNTECIDILSKFCYTMIVNYSLYSFDTGSYIRELTSDVKEIRINEHGIAAGFTNKNLKEIKKLSETQRDNYEFLEAKSWLPGILWKYDGYQIPLLITPNRQEGQVNQRKEYINGKERLLSLAILRDKKGKRTFNQINNKETIDKITLKLDYTYARKTYYSVFEKSFPNLSKTIRLCFYNLVRNTLIIKYSLKETRNSIETAAAWYYIVYKFFDIVRTYPDCKDDWLFLQTITKRLDSDIINRIKGIIDKVCSIHSPATRLLLRCIYYLKFDIIGTTAENIQSNTDNEYEISIDRFSQEADSIQKSNEIVHYVDELLPPPIFTLDFMLYSCEDSKKENVITFETLSSGEKQLTLSLSTIYYYLSNLDSISNKNNRIKQGQVDNIISYSHVCVIFDELELYFHPEMQRTFISRLLSGLKQLSFKHIESIQFIMVTHSPFILSDVPRKNVLFLDRNGNPQRVEDMHTFGANIHTMLEHSFFLKDGTIGAFAKRIIGEIEVCLNIHKICCNYNRDEKKTEEEKSILLKEKYEGEHDFLDTFFDNNAFNFDKFNETYPKERIRATIDLFDEPIIKKVLLNDYYEVFPMDKKKDSEKMINRWKKQLASLLKLEQGHSDDEGINELISELQNKIKSLKNEK